MSSRGHSTFVSPTGLVLALAAALALLSGCSWLSSNPHKKPGASKQPFAPTASDSDLIFIRTGDRRYYYVIDRKRELCFFHAPMYGQKHMAQMDCRDLPEYEELTGNPPPEGGAPEEPVDETGDPGESGDGSDAGAITDEDRTAFRRAWIQRFCAARAGYEEPREVLLGRHGLAPETFDALEAELNADAAAQKALEAEADSICPKTD